MAAHALLSPSSASKWMACPGALALEAGIPDRGSEAADDGTATHFLAAECLTDKTLPAEHIGKVLHVIDGDARWAVPGVAIPDDAQVCEVDMDRAGRANLYVQEVRKRAVGGLLYVEQRLPIEQLTGEPGASGTADAVVITADNWLEIHDLKDGHIPVRAEENKQLMIYGVAALDEFAAAGPFAGVRLGIHQPKNSPHPDVWEPSFDRLLEFAREIREAAKVARIAYEYRDNWIGKGTEYLVPGDTQCRWCRAAAGCRAREAQVIEAVGADFEEYPVILEANHSKALPVDLGSAPLHVKMQAVPLIEVWCKAVRAEVERQLLASAEVPGYKLVQGKQGNRAWSDEAEAEKVLKSMRLKDAEMYEFKTISPTTAEKLFGPKGSQPSDRRWTRLQGLIVRAAGGMSVAAASDPRPAISLQPAVECFDDETGGDLV